MIRRMIWGLIVVASVTAIGCGGGSGGGSGPADPPPPPPVVLTALEIICTDTNLDEGDAVAMSALGTYSNGTQSAVAADWTTPHANKVTLSSTHASSITVTSISDGTATVTAISDGLSASVVLTIEWAIPPDPGTVYGCIEGGTSVYRYPSDGTSAPTLIAAGGGNGLTYDKSLNVLYALNGTVLTRIDPTTSGTTVVADVPPDTNAHISLDLDSSGRVYMQGYLDGEVYRYDPVLDATAKIGDTGGGMMNLTIGPDGTIYYAPVWLSGSGCIWRHDLATNTTAPWAPMPSLSGSFPISGGVVMNRKGIAYTAIWTYDFAASVSTSSIYRIEDVDGNGTISDSEVTLFATAPGGYMVIGFANAGGGSILANLNPDGGWGAQGIYWLRDLDEDGTTIGDTATEFTRYHPIPLGGNGDPQCLASTR